MAFGHRNKKQNEKTKYTSTSQLKSDKTKMFFEECNIQIDLKYKLSCFFFFLKTKIRQRLEIKILLLFFSLVF